ncbi:MAG: RNA polymerase sigma factor [Candidatus Hodgkinia cicadicola]|nr:MAG: RNA polymerase sigma factor [Candidatus Hodgkinia cicadicola]
MAPISVNSVKTLRFTQSQIFSKLRCLQSVFFVNAVRLPIVTALMLSLLEEEYGDCLTGFKLVDRRQIKLCSDFEQDEHIGTETCFVCEHETCDKRGWEYLLECGYSVSALASCFQFRACECRRCSLCWALVKLLMHNIKDNVDWQIQMTSLLLKANVDYKLAQLIRVVIITLKRKWLFNVLDCECAFRPLALLRWALVCESEIRRCKRSVVSDSKWLAAWVFKTCFQRSLNKSGIVGAGRLGLLISVNRFDFHSGFKFSTYARWWVMHRMLDMSMSSATAQNFGTDILKIRSVGIGQNVSNTISIVKANRYRTVSLDQTIGDNCDLHAVTAYDDSAADVKCCEDVARAFKSLKRLTLLSPREERVLRLRGHSLTDFKWSLAKIGFELGLSKERIRQIELLASARVRALNERAMLELLCL